MRRGLLACIVGSWLCSSCTSSLESRSSGQIGCRPQDITISEASTDRGLLDSTQTWVAECAGRRFMCSEQDKSQLEGELLTTPGGFAVSCVPIIGDEDDSPRVAPTSTPPTGAAGFDFGWSLGQAKNACESAGHEWTKGQEGRRSCSGPVEDLGFDAEVQLRGCDGKVCEISIWHRPKRDWVGAIIGLQATLRDKYGTPTDESRSVGCDDDDVTRCVEDGRLRISDDWKWHTRERLRLLVLPPEPQEGPPAIRIVYTKPPTAMEAKGSAL